MRVSWEEPTGIVIRDHTGESVTLTFPAFITALEQNAVLPDDEVWSRIMTGGQWVRAGDMRLFQIVCLGLPVRPVSPPHE